MTAQSFEGAGLRKGTRRRRPLRAAACLLIATALVHVSTPADAQAPQDILVMGLAQEPTPGLDPTVGAASAIGEVSLYNLFETLTKINEDGSVSPLLALSWTVSSDSRIYTFQLRQGVRFHNGERFTSAVVRYSLHRAAMAYSVNKDKETFANIAQIETPDEHTVVLRLAQGDTELPFKLGLATAIMVEPKSAGENNASPVGTGPYRLKTWQRGSSIVLERWDGHRSAAKVSLRVVKFKFVHDPATQAAALLTGGIDVLPRAGLSRAIHRFSSDKSFQVLRGQTRTRTILAMNHRRPPLDDERVRRAIHAAIDRHAVIEGSLHGLGATTDIGYAPSASGVAGTAYINRFDPLKARSLLIEAGVTLPLHLSLKVPQSNTNQRGAEIVAAQLAKVGIVATIETLEVPQWIANVQRRRDFDLTLVAHVDPLEFGSLARPNHYWGYRSAAFSALWERIHFAEDAPTRQRLLAQAHQVFAEDAVAVYLYSPTVVTIANARLRGLRTHMPVAVNDLSALSWQ